MITPSKRSTAVGVFDHATDAQRAVQELRRMGFTETQIGVTSKGQESAELATKDQTENVVTGAGTGAAAGAGAGALWGLGIAFGVLPAIGPVVAGGTLAAILASAATGAATGGVVGALVGLGVPENEAARYEEEFQAGRTIVTVQAPASRFAQAVDVMERAGARSNESMMESVA